MDRSKFLVQRLLPVALFMAAQGADAATIDPAELQVGGTVRVPSCSIVASEGGTYDFGRRSQAVLPVTGHVALTPQTQSWAVDCGSARTYLMYSITDNRADTVSAAAVTNFGLGGMPGVEDSRIGYYTVTMMRARVDGVAKSVLYVDASGTIADSAVDVVYYKTRRGYSWHTGTGSGGPWVDFRSQPGSHFEVDLKVAPQLASRSVVGGGKPITEEVNLDGSATVTFSFGL